MLASRLFDLVWLNEASLPNFSFLGSLEVAQIYLFGVGWGGFTVLIIQVSVQIGPNWNYQLELSLAKMMLVLESFTN